MTDEPTLAVRHAQQIEQLLEVLDLTPIGTARIAVTGVDGDESTTIGTDSADVFEGQSIEQLHNRTFGGQVLAQALMAASLTIRDAAPERRPHSLHAYFMRPGDDKLPIRFAVERMRDGRSFSTRRVHAIQHGRPILSLTGSFQDPAGGLDHQDPMPQSPDPRALPSQAELYDRLENPHAKRLAERPFDHRYPAGDVALTPREPHAAHQQVWVRTISEPVDDPFLRASILAFLSDFSLLESVLRRHGLAWSDRRLRVASLDHAMWFHRDVDPSTWMLYDQSSPSAQSGRGLCVGRIFTEDGTLVASVAQEGMTRVKGDVDPSGPSRASTPAGGAQPVGRPLPGWAPRDALAPTVLEGETVRLRPLTTDDADDFFAALDGPDLPRELFTYLMTEPPADATEMRDIIRAALAAPASWPLAIVVDEQVVGMASYLRIDPAIGSAEVGNILYSPALQRTTAATEAMHLMAAHAFEQGYRRYEWKCDALNAPSRAAARRLGFVEEGTFRNALVCKGRNRDTTWFSITDDEWPAVAAAHRAWLDEARAGTPSPLASHLRR